MNLIVRYFHFSIEAFLVVSIALSCESYSCDLPSEIEPTDLKNAPGLNGRTHPTLPEENPLAVSPKKDWTMQETRLLFSLRARAALDHKVVLSAEEAALVAAVIGEPVAPGAEYKLEHIHRIMDFAYRRLAFMVAQETVIMTKGVSREVLYSAARAEIWLCIDSYDPARGVPFANYFLPLVRQGVREIARFESSHPTPVPLYARVAVTIATNNLKSRFKASSINREPTASEIAKEIVDSGALKNKKIDADWVRYVREQISFAKSISYDGEFRNDNDDDFDILALVPGNRDVPIELADFMKHLLGAIQSIDSPIIQKILLLRLGINLSGKTAEDKFVEPLTLQEIATNPSLAGFPETVTRAWVQQLEKRGMDHIQKRLKDFRPQ